MREELFDEATKIIMWYTLYAQILIGLKSLFRDSQALSSDLAALGTLYSLGPFPCEKYQLYGISLSLLCLCICKARKLLHLDIINLRRMRERGNYSSLCVCLCVCPGSSEFISGFLWWIVVICKLLKTFSSDATRGFWYKGFYEEKGAIKCSQAAVWWPYCRVAIAPPNWTTPKIRTFEHCKENTSMLVGQYNTRCVLASYSCTWMKSCAIQDLVCDSLSFVTKLRVLHFSAWVW